MCKSFLSGNSPVGEIALGALLLGKKIAEINQDAFVRKMNELVHKEARKHCFGCYMDDLSQLKHECMMKKEEEIWICHYDEAKNLFRCG